MCLLAHACIATNGEWARAARRELDERIQFEIQEAQRIQKQVPECSWGEALRLAAGRKLKED